MPDPIPATIKTACGRHKYQILARRPGLLARLRLAWFVTIASLRDWPLPADGPAEADGAEGPDPRS